jgi:hypothetical protein
MIVRACGLRRGCCRSLARRSIQPKDKYVRGEGCRFEPRRVHVFTWSTAIRAWPASVRCTFTCKEADCSVVLVLTFFFSCQYKSSGVYVYMLFARSSIYQCLLRGMWSEAQSECGLLRKDTRNQRCEFESCHVQIFCLILWLLKTART